MMTFVKTVACGILVAIWLIDKDISKRDYLIALFLGTLALSWLVVY